MAEKSLMLTDYAPGSATYASLSFLNMLEEDWDAAIASSDNLRATRDQQLALLDFIRAGDFEGGLQEVRRMAADPSILPAPFRSRHLLVLTALMDDPELVLELFHTINIPDGTLMAPIREFWNEYGREVRQLEGYKEILELAGLVDYYRATGNWPDSCQPLEGNDDFECF
jgi:hypothetical protein